MNETEQHILKIIRVWVWSGFLSPDEVQEKIDDILEDDIDEEKLSATVRPEFVRKAIAEASWPERTDCERLDRASSDLNDRGIIALQNAGCPMSDGLSDVSAASYQIEPHGRRCPTRALQSAGRVGRCAASCVRR